jgi:hypothetical protein
MNYTVVTLEGERVT